MSRPLKIAFVVPDNRDELRRYGDPLPHFGTAPAALLDGFTLLPDECEIHVVNCVQSPVTVPEKIGPNIFYHTAVVGKWGWLRGAYLGCIRSVREQLQKIRPDIVHGQGSERYAALAAAFSGFPNVLTIHGNMKAVAAFYHAPIGSYYWLAARLEDFVLPRTAGVFCNSAYTEKLVSPRATRTWRVSNALRMDFFSPLTASRSSTVPVLLNVGVDEPRKRQVELLAVAQRLYRRGQRFELQFAGSLTKKTAYSEAFARELACAEQAGYARHLGNLPTVQLIAAMDAASALVHFPSEEAFGLVVAEALARNLKLFAAATGGVVDIVQGIEGAELFEPQDFTGLEEAIANWLKAGVPRPQNAASVMLQRYHPTVIARRHMEIYRQVLEKRF